jgi:hypothetical protein
LFAATGAVYPEIESTLPAYPFRTPRLIFRNLGTKFEELIEEAGPGIAAVHSSRGAAFGDIDNDGDVDAVVVNLDEPPSLLRNDLNAAGRHWLRVRVDGTSSNRSAIGARVVVRYGGRLQVQAVLSQSSYYSVNDFRLHFGLGTAEVADVEIRWPSGGVQKVLGVKVDQTVVVKEAGQ